MSYIHIQNFIKIKNYEKTVNIKNLFSTVIRFLKIRN